jgi:prophage antirepressor-like protein
MVNEVMKFDNEVLNVEFVARECNGKYLFPSAPIIKALGYTNTTDTLNKHVFPEYQFRFRNITGKGGKPTIFLSEPGLYQLIMRSHTPNAKKFQKWVFEEVLPSLRTKGYAVSETITDEQVAKLVTDAKDKAKLIEAQGKVVRVNDRFVAALKELINLYENEKAKIAEINAEELFEEK